MKICDDGFFGAECLPLVYISYTLPTDASDTGGSEIRLFGYNFVSKQVTNTSILYECRFGNIAKMNASLISMSELICISPKVELLMGSMEVELFVDVDGQASYNSVPFLFYGLCPENECSKGYCAFGRCVVSCFIF